MKAQKEYEQGAYEILRQLVILKQLVDSRAKTELVEDFIFGVINQFSAFSNIKSSDKNKLENMLNIKARKSKSFYRLAKEWLSFKEQHLRAKTFTNYQNIALNSLKPLHKIQLHKLKLKHICKLLEGFVATPHACKQNYLILLDILRHDLDDEVDSKLLQALGKKQFLAQFYKGEKPEHIKTLVDKKSVHGFYEELIKLKHTKEKLKLSMMFMMHTALRSANVIKLCWSDVDIINKRLILNKSVMKNKKDFSLPLSEASLKILKQIYELNQPKSRDEKVFKISYNPLRLGFAKVGKLGLTPHSVRSMFSTLANEYRHEHGEDAQAIERFLAHTCVHGVQAAYNHANYERSLRRLAAWWSKFLCTRYKDEIPQTQQNHAEYFVFDD